MIKLTDIKASSLLVQTEMAKMNDGKNQRTTEERQRLLRMKERRRTESKSDNEESSIRSLLRRLHDM